MCNLSSNFLITKTTYSNHKYTSSYIKKITNINLFNCIILFVLREGHSQPPSMVAHCEPTGHNLLAAGSDSSLHIMNTVSETFNKSLGKASHNRKASKKKSKFIYTKKSKGIILVATPDPKIV